MTRADEPAAGAKDAARELREATEELRRMDRETRNLARSIGGQLRRAFDDAVFSGAKLSDVLRSVGSGLSRSAYSGALRPLQSALGDGLADLAQSGVSAALAAGTGAGPARAFAKGGVVERATAFSARAGPGVMGEAGPEAILPLARGADGRLGVRGAGGGGAQVTVNISTPDIEGFRRSQSQIAGALARAVRRGERNL